MVPSRFRDGRLLRSLRAQGFRRRLTAMEAILLGIITTYVVIVSLVNPAFFGWATLADLSRNGIGTLLLATGLLVVVISGGIDISFPAVAIFSGYSAVRLLLWMEADSLLLAFVLACAVGALLGSLNAVLIHLFRLPTLIVTIGTASVFFGTMTLLIGTKPVTVSQMPPSMLRFADTTLLTVGSGPGAGRISVFVLIGAAVLALTWFLLYRTSIGLSIFALGSNPEGARRAGFPILLTQLAIYSYVGVLAGAMCIVYFSNLRFVNPTSLVGTELPIIAAVVIGGAKITGGEGTLFGTLLGVVLIQLMNNTLVFLHVTTSLNNVVIGGVMLVSLSVLYLQERRRNQRLLRFVG